MDWFLSVSNLESRNLKISRRKIRFNFLCILQFVRDFEWKLICLYDDLIRQVKQLRIRRTNIYILD